jgi:hypothetical protein
LVRLSHGKMGDLDAIANALVAESDWLDVVSACLFDS